MLPMIIINGLVLSLTYFLIASGLTVVFSIMGIINFAHGAIIMLGGMVAYYSFTFLNINFYLSVILAMATTAIFSVVLKRIVFDHFAKYPLQGCIAAVGIAMIIQQGALVGLGGEDKVFVNALPQDLVNLFGVTVTLDRITIVLVSFFIMIGMLAFLHTQEPIASQLCGVNNDYVSAISMALGGALAGAAGALLGAMFTVSPYWGESLILKAFVVIIIGGLGGEDKVFVNALPQDLVNLFGVTVTLDRITIVLVSFFIMIGMLAFLHCLFI